MGTVPPPRPWSLSKDSGDATAPPWRAASPPDAPVPAPWAYTPHAGTQPGEGLGAGAGNAGDPSATSVGPGAYGGIGSYGGPASGQWHVPPPRGAAYGFPTSPQPPSGSGFLTGTAWFGPPLANWGQRAGALLIDYLAAIVPPFILFVIGIASAQTLGAGVVLFLLLGVAWFFGYVIYQVVGEGRTGQGLGKRVVGIRVVRESDGQPLGVGQAFGRHLLHIIDYLPAVVIVIPLGYLWPLWHNKRQTWADMVLGSVVLSDR